MIDEFENNLKFIRKVCLYNGYDYDDTGNYNTNGRLSNIRL